MDRRYIKSDDLESAIQRMIENANKNAKLSRRTRRRIARLPDGTESELKDDLDLDSPDISG